MLSSSTTTKRLSAVWIVLFLLLGPCFGQPPQDKPYVLLISLDGFRYDYAERDHATNLLALGQSGVAAKALIPSFPTTTFPNHYTIVTGLYPAHHGIVDNSFWDPERQRVQVQPLAATTDGRWWGGTPLWVLAEQQGMRAASFFWVGSDAEIQQTRPTYFYKYDGKIPNEQRVAQVVEWLKLPKPKRPHFITLYFSEWIMQATHSDRMHRKHRRRLSRSTRCSASYSVNCEACAFPSISSSCPTMAWRRSPATSIFLKWPISAASKRSE